MIVKLYCQHCHELFPLPDDEFARDAAVEWFGEVHIRHLVGDQDIFVVTGSMKATSPAN